MIEELGIALLMLDFGQLWAIYDFVQHIAQNQVRLWATYYTKSHTTLGDMMGPTILHKIFGTFSYVFSKFLKIFTIKS